MKNWLARIFNPESHPGDYKSYTSCPDLLSMVFLDFRAGLLLGGTIRGGYAKHLKREPGLNSSHLWMAVTCEVLSINQFDI